MDEIYDASMTVLAEGHQWYWNYKLGDFLKDNGECVEFDSYMIPTEDLEPGQLRMLDVDARVVIPVDTHIRFLVTGSDVIHDFAVPALGLKIDAIPGRLTKLLYLRSGKEYFMGNVLRSVVCYIHLCLLLLRQFQWKNS